MKFGQFLSYDKRQNFSEKFYKTATWKLVLDLFVFGKNKQNFCWKIKFLKQASYIRYVIAKLSESVQTACRPH